MTDFETRAADWLDYTRALDRILRSAHALAPETVDLDQAVGRALSSPVTAAWPLPPRDNSAMDGYAVIGADIEGATEGRPVSLEVVDRVLAGQVSDRRLSSGQAIRIMTGGPVPEGADTVVRVEHTDREATEGTVRVLRDADRGRHIRPGGQDWKAGETALPPGTAVTPGAVGVLAAAGAARVRVHRRPHLAVLPTGDELFDVAAPPSDRRPAQIPESNSHMVAAQAVAAGAHARRIEAARDEDEALETAIGQAFGADVLVTIGGASMGEGDRVKRVLDGLGYRQHFWRAKIRPGSPFSFGTLPTPEGDLRVFGLPGNPASAFVTFEIFVRPFLRALAGHDRPLRPRLRVKAGEPLHSAEHLTHFLRIRLTETNDGLRAVLNGPQGSGLVSSLADADGLAVVPAGTRTVDVDEPVEIILLD